MKKFWLIIVKKLQHFYGNHRFIILWLSVLYLISLVISLLIESNRFFLAGEYNFSFEYFQHVANILTDFRTIDGELLRSSVCINCVDIYNYSRWYTLFKHSFLGLGTLLGLHPFISYIFLSISLQCIALYLCFKIFFKQFHWLSFIVASAVLIITPYKFKLIGSGSLYSFHYAFLISFLSLFIYLLQHLNKIKMRKLVLISVSTGIIVSFFLNISIGYAPILAYATILVCIYFYKQILKSIPKFLILSLIIGLIPVLINLPMVLSIIFRDSGRHYTNFNSFLWQDAITSAWFMFSNHTKLGVFFYMMTVILFLVSQINVRTKLVLLGVYTFIFLILLGNNLFFPLYGYLFHHLPLMDTIRSSHRYIFFEIFILVIFIFTGLNAFHFSESKLKQLLEKAMGLLLIFVLLINLYTSLNHVHSSVLPEEYFEASEYISNSKLSTIYFPAYMPIHNSMTGNYSWLQEDSIGDRTIYKNPFTSLLAVPNMRHVETYHTDIRSQELRNLINYTNEPDAIIEALQYKGIEQLVLDKNFNWSEQFPEFDISKIEDSLQLQKQFGNIYIYQLRALPEKCIPSYGNFKNGYCITKANPTTLIGRTQVDYALDQITQSNTINTISFIEKATNIHHIIPYPPLTDYVLQNKIYISIPVIGVDEPISDLLTATITQSGSYILAFPVLYVEKETEMYQKMNITVRLNGKTIKTITPYNQIPNFSWAVIPIKTEDNAIVTISTVGTGFVVFGEPMIITEADFQTTISQMKEIPILRHN